jgi:hypothetical protein
MVELSYIMILLTAAAALVRPIGKDLQVLAFAIPWNAIMVEIGVSLVLYQVVIMILVAKYSFTGQFQIDRVQRPIYLLAVIAIGVIAAAYTLIVEGQTVEIVGGEWRNGWRRALVVTSVFCLNLSAIVLVSNARHRIDLRQLLGAFLAGVVVLTLVGFFQVASWLLTGFDPFPIGIMSGVDEITRSAIFKNDTFAFLRMCSLGGEPKTTGVAISTGMLVMLTFGDLLVPDARRRIACWSVLILGLYLCMSTSAFFATAVGLPIAWWIKHQKAPLTAGMLAAIPLLFIGVVLALQFNYVNTYNLVRDTVVDGRELTLLDYIRRTTIDRIEVEDFDYLMLQSFLHDPMGLVTGRGFGLGHIQANVYAPPELSHYITGATAISPKSGIVLLLVNSGIAGLIYFILFLTGQLPINSRGALFNAEKVTSQRVINRQALGVAAIMIMSLRAEQFVASLLLVGAVGTLAIVQSTRVSPARPAAFRWRSRALAWRR